VEFGAFFAAGAMLLGRVAHVAGLVIPRQTFVRRCQNCLADTAAAGPVMVVAGPRAAHRHTGTPRNAAEHAGAAVTVILVALSVLAGLVFVAMMVVALGRGAQRAWAVAMSLTCA
jgi:hypothetical protein